MTLQEEQFLQAVCDENIDYITAHVRDITKEILRDVFVTSPSISVCEVLLKSGVDVDIWARIVPYSGPHSAPQECTALYFACKNEMITKARWLLGHGANVESGWRSMPPSIDEYEESTPLKAAVANGNVQLVALLLQYHADVNNKNESFDTALDVALAQNPINVGIINLLKSAGVNLSPEIDKKIAGYKKQLQKNLVHACRWGRLSDVDALLLQGADVNGTDLGESPLQNAVLSDNPQMVEFLLKQGAVVTPYVLKLAENHHNEEIIALFKTAKVKEQQ